MKKENTQNRRCRGVKSYEYVMVWITIGQKERMEYTLHVHTHGNGSD